MPTGEPPRGWSGGRRIVVRGPGVNLEWRFPIYRWLGGVAFFDAGAVTPEVHDFSFADFYPGVGGGLRITTPIGPIRLDVGYALRQVLSEDRLQVYLTIGHAF